MSDLYARTVTQLRTMTALHGAEGSGGYVGPAGRELEDPCLVALRDLGLEAGSSVAIEAVVAAGAGWLLDVLLQRALETLPDDEQLIEVEYGVIKRRGDCSIAEQRRAADLLIETTAVQKEVLELIDEARENGLEIPDRLLRHLGGKNQIALIQRRNELRELVKR